MPSCENVEFMENYGKSNSTKEHFQITFEISMITVP